MTVWKLLANGLSKPESDSVNDIDPVVAAFSGNVEICKVIYLTSL